MRVQRHAEQGSPPRACRSSPRSRAISCFHNATGDADAIETICARFDLYCRSCSGAARTVPRLARLAVFSETADGWKLQALAALGTGENDVSDKAAEVVSRWRGAVASRDPAAIRQLASRTSSFNGPMAAAYRLTTTSAERSSRAGRRRS
jgi:hypothetical protein